MSDRANDSLKHITQSGEYVLVPNVVCFDEHDEHDAKGKLLRRFDRTRLQRIADQCNRRERETGDLAPGGPGHTKDDVRTEEDQPPIFLYARNYRVAPFGPQGKIGLLCDYYVQKKITTNDGKVVNGVDYVKSFPRRSVELWPESNTIDWHAILRRSPQRDLGLLAYAREAGVAATINYSPTRQVIGAITNKGKLRYSMESPMPDNTNPVLDPNADISADLPEDDGPPEGHEEFAKHLDYAMKNHPCLKYMAGVHKKYEADAANPPGADVPKDMPAETLQPDRMQRAGDVQVSRYQKQIDETKAEVAQLKHEKKMLRFEKTLNAIRDDEGIEIDVTSELDDVSPLDDAGFDKHVAKIRKCYQRTPVGGDLPPDAIERDPGENKLEKHADEIIRYMRANNITGDGAFYRAAKALNYTK